MNSSKTAATNSGLSEERRLFIPGPTWVDNEARQAMCGDMMGHRSTAFRELYDASQPVLQQMAGTARHVYLATCSSWGMMQAALHNLVRPGKRVLNCCCGAFSDRWHDVTLKCGIEADALRVPWGQSIEPGMLQQALEQGSYDLVTLVHAETSTGVLNPLKELAAIVNKYDDTLLAVDVVSSYSATPIDMDSWGIDTIMAGTQKALALPPGMTVCAISERALHRAGSVPSRGFYFDYLEYERNAVESMTISTPNIPLVMGLAHRASEITAEGLENRYARHKTCRRYVIDTMAAYGWSSIAPQDRQADTLSCLRPPADIDTVSYSQELTRRTGYIIDPGYGILKGKSIRISNMGVLSPNELTPLLASLHENA